MDRMVRIAVLGCGRIGRTHARALARNRRAAMTHVYDIVPAIAADTASELGVKAAESIAEILELPELDAILIATPTPSHVDLITAFARRGKAILCEKPIGLDMKRVRDCEKSIEGLAPTILIGFNRRFDPSFRTLRDRVKAGEIGVVEQVVITSRDPAPPSPDYISGSGGLFRDMTIHDFDMARYIVGHIVEVHASGANLIDQAIGAAGDIDTAMLTLRAQSGALVHINNSRRCAYGYDQRLEVFGSSGLLLANNQRATTVRRFGSDGTNVADVVLPFFVERYAQAYAAEIEHFLDCVTGTDVPLANFSDGVEALRLADAAQESLESRQVVRLEQ